VVADGCWRWGSRSADLRVGSRARRGEHLHEPSRGPPGQHVRH
jgi:hypothetical protein